MRPMAPVGILGAVQFLTRVPIRLRAAPDLAASVAWFPVVGALLGAAIGAVAAGLDHVVPATVAASVRKTNRCVIVEEGWPVAGIGAQVVDDLQREAFDWLDAPVLRVTGADVPMPYSKQLEKLAKPDVPRIVAAVNRVLYRA